MSDDYEIHVVKVPMMDTGIGREAGFRDDAHLIEVATAEREAALSLLTPEARARIEAAESEMQRRFIVGG